MKSLVLGLVVAISCTHCLIAQTSESVVLIPIYSSASNGALGSRWQTHLTIRNDTPGAVLFTPLRCESPCAGPDSLAPQSTRMEDAIRPGLSFEGRLIRFSTPTPAQIAFELRVNDMSRNAQSAGTEIPVVRENDLRTRVLLLNIPTDERFRQSLRIYDLANGMKIRLRIFAVDANEPLVDARLDLLQPPEATTTPAQIAVHGLTDQYPILRTVDALRVEIDASDSTQRLWAFVSITNNSSQEFTTISP